MLWINLERRKRRNGEFFSREVWGKKMRRLSGRNMRFGSILIY